MNSRPCPACTSTGPRETLFRQQFARIEDVSILDGYTVVACAACGMTFADHIPDQTAFNSYYAAASKYATPTTHDAARLHVVADAVAQAIPDRNARILDVGCGTGQLLAALAARSYSTLTGLDPSPACTTAAIQHGGFAIQHGTIDAVAVGQFDAILMIGVLEHLVDVQRLLAVVRARLAPAGVLYLEVPDVARFDRFPNAPYQEFSVEHVNYFSAASLANTFRTVGMMPSAYDVAVRRQSAIVLMPTMTSLMQNIAPPPLPHYIPDPISEAAIHRYIAHDTARERPLHEAIDALVASQEPIVLWGAGTRTLRLFATTPLAKANIVWLVDANTAYHNRSVCGHVIHSPERIATSVAANPLNGTARILIASVPFEHEIRARIAELHLPNAVGTLP